MNTEILNLWSETTAISVAIWMTLIITVLYLGRPHAHQLIKSSGRALHNAFRIWSKSIGQLERRVVQRNTDVILASGQEAIEKNIEREFARVNAVVSRDLSKYPSLHRKISDTIEKVEKDYHESTDSAPLPPAWIDVIKTISALPTNGDATIVKVLNGIKQTVQESHDQTLKSFQKSSMTRHKILSGMQPEWRKLTTSLEDVKDTIEGLDARTKTIDNQMEAYQQIRAREDKAIHTLTSSSLTQFFISGLVLAIAIMGGLINFQLIAMPMSEMVGGASYIGSMKTSDIAALVIILIEIAMGLFLLESLRITSLFPIIGSMDDRMRRKMMIITFTILTILASIEASLAYMRDLLALDRETLQQSLVGASTGLVEAQFRWIPSIGQMVMGFILPFALAFIAIPLESFIHSIRTVFGLIVVFTLRTLNLVIKMIAGFMLHISKILVSLYDLVIMIPLSIERLIKSTTHMSSSAKAVKLNKKSDPSSAINESVA